jgi:hypothetical protein
MTPWEAKRMMASYLTGRRVSREDLEQARALIGEEGPTRRFLAEELGTHEEWVSECDVFLSRLAEFSELAAEERERRMPRLAAHLEACPACRQAYWDVKPLWITRVAREAAGGVQEMCRGLAERIRLGVDQVGRLLEEGLCPPSLVLEPLAAGAPGRVAAAHRVWELRDEDSGAAIHLEIAGGAGGGIAVNCALESLEPLRPGMIRTRGAVAPPRLEVLRQPGGELLLSGSLTDFQTEPFVLPPGEWVIRVSGGAGTEGCLWEIPLSVEAKPSAGEETPPEEEEEPE